MLGPETAQVGRQYGFHGFFGSKIDITVRALFAVHCQHEQASRDRPGTVALRVLVILICFPIGVAPSFTHPKPDEVNAGTSTARYFSDAWEPSGRDRIHALTEEAERFGPRKPCLWYKVAMLERLIGRDLEALRDERRAGSPIAVCRWLGP